MLIAYSELKNYVLNANDGEIGRVRDLLFDDQFWVMRYIDVNTSKWFLGRRVLISPIAIDQPDTDERHLNVALTKQQVKDSPSIEHDEPVSQQYTRAYNKYFSYPHYWAGQEIWGMSPYPGNLRPPINSQEATEFQEEEEQIGHSHLRSAQEVKSYVVKATDDDIGKVEDFLLDTETWQIRYVVIDTKRLMPEAHVLLAASWIEDIVWHNHSVQVNVSKKAIETAPHFDGAITRNKEIATYKHFNRAPYWEPMTTRTRATSTRASNA